MKFSIRDLILVTAVVGLCVGWLDHRRLEESERKYEKERALRLALMDRMAYFLDKDERQSEELMELRAALLRTPEYNP